MEAVYCKRRGPAVRYVWRKPMKTKSVITMLACLTLIGAALADEHPSAEHPKAKPAAEAAAKGAGALDGKVFAGQMVKSGDAKGDDDELTFKGGTFVSSACVQYGFHATAYTATEKDGVITFNSTAKNADGDTMSWKGTVKGGVLEATAVNKSKAGETTYVFKGSQGHADANAGDHPKN
jgi:hypothetical protein